MKICLILSDYYGHTKFWLSSWLENCLRLIQDFRVFAPVSHFARKILYVAKLLQYEHTEKLMGWFFLEHSLSI